MSVIRIQETPEIAAALALLQQGEYSLLNKTEIIKAILSKEAYKTQRFVQFRTRVKTKTDASVGVRKKSDLSQKEIEENYQKALEEGKEAGKKWLAKKGLKMENLNEEQIFELIENA